MLPWLLAWTLPVQAGTVTLQNDAFDEAGDQLTAQCGFAAEECFASVFEPDPSLYPYDLSSIRLLIGSTGTFVVEIWSVDANLEPAVRLGAEGAWFAGDMNYDVWQELDIASLELPSSAWRGLEEPVAIAVCMPDASKWPGLGCGGANDTDGNAPTWPDRNWIYADIGPSLAWFRSGDLGVRGDWILRLTIESAGAGGGTTTGGTTGTTGGTTTGTVPGTGGEDTGDGGDTGVAALRLDAVVPDEAPAGQAVDIVLLGDGFQEGIEATIGGLAITGLAFVNDQTLSGRSPSALPVGVHDVEVRLPDGPSAWLPEAFAVVGEPTDTGTPGEGGCGCGGGAAPGWGLLPGLVALLRRRRGA